MNESAIYLAVSGKNFERTALNSPRIFVAIFPFTDLTVGKKSDNLCLPVGRVEDEDKSSIIQQ